MMRNRRPGAPTHNLTAERKGVDPLQNENSIASGTANLVAATISIGLVSYAVIYVGSRTFEADQLSVFLSLWALVNTLALSLAFPLEMLAPQVLTNGSTEPHPRRLLPHPLVSHAILFGLVAGVVTATAGVAMASEVTLGLQAGVMTFALSIGLWSGRRAMWFGSGDFSRARNGSSSQRRSCRSLLLAVVLVVAPDSVTWLFVAVAFGNVIGGTLWPRGPVHFDSERRFFLPDGSLPSPLGLDRRDRGDPGVAERFARPGRTPGASSPSRSWCYAALLSLVRVPMMLLNNVMGPLNLRIVRLSATGDFRSVRRLFIGGTGLILRDDPGPRWRHGGSRSDRCQHPRWQQI